jgi:putative tryptophan/tyrosine transport system substrate-binding protein
MTFPSSAKRLALLHELVPRAAVIAVLQDPKFVIHETETRKIETAVRAMGLEIITVKAATEQEINAAFSTVARSGAGALLVGGGPFFNARRNQLIGLAALHAIPASYFERGFVDAGGLISFDQLWSKPDRCLSPCWRLCRPHSQGREAGRSSG